MYRSLALIVLNGEKLGEFTFFPNQTMAMLQDNEILELSISCRRNLKMFRKSTQNDRSSSKGAKKIFTLFQY